MNEKKQTLSKAKYGLLNHSTGIIFAGQHLERFIGKTFKQGYVRLGELVQLSEEELARLVPTPNARQKVVAILADMGLGMALFGHDVGVRCYPAQFLRR